MGIYFANKGTNIKSFQMVNATWILGVVSKQLRLLHG